MFLDSLADLNIGRHIEKVSLNFGPTSFGPIPELPWDTKGFCQHFLFIKDIIKLIRVSSGQIKMLLNRKN